MSKLREYVEEVLHDDERHAIIESYEQYERDGFIGDAPVRNHARAFIVSLGIVGYDHITLWMEKLAMECYRHYYHNGR